MHEGNREGPTSFDLSLQGSSNQLVLTIPDTIKRARLGVGSALAQLLGTSIDARNLFVDAYNRQGSFIAGCIFTPSMNDGDFMYAAFGPDAIDDDGIYDLGPPTVYLSQSGFALRDVLGGDFFNIYLISVAGAIISGDVVLFASMRLMDVEWGR